VVPSPAAITPDVQPLVLKIGPADYTERRVTIMGRVKTALAGTLNP
jgi:hypothetical protein